MTFRFKEVACFVQGHAAMMANQKILKKHEYVLSHDIGGGTWNIILFGNDPRHKGEKKILKVVTLEHGIIYLYRDIINYINSEFSIKYTEDMIDNILQGGNIPGISEEKKEDVRSVINFMAQEYLQTGIKLMKEEGMKTTPNKMIHIGQPIQLPDDFFDQLEDLRQSAFDEDSDIRKDVQHMVDTYHYDENTTHGIKKTKDKELNESSLCRVRLLYLIYENSPINLLDRRSILKWRFFYV